MMRSIDFSPLFRSGIGFDAMSRLLENAMQQDESSNSYPPYNITKNGDNQYGITMAVAGFAEDELEITQQQASLIIKGKAKPDSDGAQYLHKGIATRAFERRFHLADHVKVVDAKLHHGLLHISLLREIPEAARPRKIAINNSNSVTIEQSAA